MTPRLRSKTSSGISKKGTPSATPSWKALRKSPYPLWYRRSVSASCSCRCSYSAEWPATDTERRYQSGYGDLRSAFQDGVALGVPFFEIPLDVFDRNRGVINKDSHGEGQSSEGHDVDGFSEEAEGHNGRQDG